MKPTTIVHARANNVGKPNQDLSIDGLPLMEAVKKLALWILSQEMGKRIDICFGRNAQDVQIVMMDARLRNKSNYESSLDEMFDDSMFETHPTDPTHLTPPLTAEGGA